MRSEPSGSLESKAGRAPGSHTSGSFTCTVSADDKFIGFWGYWTTEYRHRISSFSGSASRFFGDRFWFSGHRFTI